MKIIVCTDKFKGTFTAVEICDFICSEIKKINNIVEVVKIPLADGGEGITEILTDFSSGKLTECIVSNPLFRKTKAEYGISGDGKTAFIEMAKASGLQLLSENERNPCNTSTFGTGELILHALNSGIRNFIIGIGGSATNDGGIGMAAALGYSFYDKNKSIIIPIGKNLKLIENIDDSGVDKRIYESSFKIACDVTNPFFGENGAAFVFGKQKGANDSEIIMLDNGLKNLSHIIKQKYQIEVENIAGSGAAGGLGGGAVAFLNGKLIKGIDLILNYTDFENQIKNADLIITGEGKFDESTFDGKVVSGVLKSAEKYNIPVEIICGISSFDGNTFRNRKVKISALFKSVPSNVNLKEESKIRIENILNQLLSSY